MSTFLFAPLSFLCRCSHLRTSILWVTRIRTLKLSMIIKCLGWVCLFFSKLFLLSGLGGGVSSGYFCTCLTCLTNDISWVVEALCVVGCSNNNSLSPKTWVCYSSSTCNWKHNSLKKKKKPYQSGLLLGIHYAVWLSK